MVALAELPVVREHRAVECSALFARLLTEYKIYTTLEVTSVVSPGLSPMLDIRRSSDAKDGDEQA
jgi:hypothetical protein